MSNIKDKVLINISKSFVFYVRLFGYKDNYDKICIENNYNLSYQKNDVFDNLKKYYIKQLDRDLLGDASYISSELQNRMNHENKKLKPEYEKIIECCSLVSNMDITGLSKHFSDSSDTLLRYNYVVS